MQSSNSIGTTAASQQLQQLQQLFANKSSSSSNSQIAPPPPQYRPSGTAACIAGVPSGSSSASHFPTPPPHPQNMTIPSIVNYGSAQNFSSDPQPPPGNPQAYRPPPMQPPFGVGTSQFSLPNQQVPQAASNDFYKLSQLFASNMHGSTQTSQAITSSMAPSEAQQQPVKPPFNASSTPWGRMSFFIDQPTSNFELVEYDLRRIFSNFSPIKDIRILADRAAAEITFTNAQAVNDCRHELEGLFLVGIGTLRFIPLVGNQTAEQVTPLPRNIQADCLQASPAPALQKNSMESFNQVNAMTQKQAGGAHTNGGGTTTDDPDGRSRGFNSREAGQQEDKTGTSGVGNGGPNKLVYRLEIIDLFGYDPEFDVTKAILGVNNSNINFIMEQAKHKVDISIKGKALNWAPIAERLHMTISSDDAEACHKAVNMCEDLLLSVCEQFVDFCLNQRYPIPSTAGFRRHEYDEGPYGNLIYRGAKERPQTWLANVRVSPPTSHHNRRSRSPVHSRVGGRDRCRDAPVRGSNNGRGGGRGRSGNDNLGDRDLGRRGGGGSGPRNMDVYSGKGRGRGGGREKGTDRGGGRCDSFDNDIDNY